MPSIPPEQLAAVRQVDLLTYLMVTSPGSLKKTAPHEWRTVEHGSLAISNGKWHWFAGNVGGRSALDYLIKVEGMTFMDAFHQVAASMQMPVPETILRNNELSEQAPKPFALPRQASSTKRVEDYLVNRGIDRELVRFCIQQGSLYESYEHHNAVFVGMDSSNQARFASLRGTYPGSKFRMDVAGSDKRYNFLFVPPGCDIQTVPNLAVFESPIDALSFITLNQKYRICPALPWYDLPCLSCSGTAHIPVLHYLQEHPNAEHLLVCFDNDAAGRKGILRIGQNIRASPDLLRQVKQLRSGIPPPERGKDWNEVLTKSNPQPGPRQKNYSPHQRTVQEVI